MMQPAARPSKRSPPSSAACPPTTGPYARIRHPQYVGFVLILLGFLLQWPTLLTLAMFPVLVFMYGYLSKSEEADMAAAFGEQYLIYAARTPRFIPKFGGPDASANARKGISP